MLSAYITRIINSKQGDSIDTWPEAGTAKPCLRMSLWILKHSHALFCSCTTTLKFINIPGNSFLIHVNAWKIPIPCKMPAHNWVFQCSSTNICYLVFHCLKICSPVHESYVATQLALCQRGQKVKLDSLHMQIDNCLSILSTEQICRVQLQLINSSWIAKSIFRALSIFTFWIIIPYYLLF